MAQRLTDAFVRSVEAPNAGRKEIADAGCVGLSFRVTDKGVRSWSFRFRDPVTRETCRFAIGTYPDVSLGKARAKADDLRKSVAAGSNPNTAKKAERDAAKVRTFEAIADRYLEMHARIKKRPKSIKEDERNIRMHLLPKLGKRRVETITRLDVSELLEGIVRRGTPILANRVHALLAKIFSFTVDGGYLNGSPMVGLKRKGVERIGRRVLSDDEIRLLWPQNERQDSPMSRRVRLALRLQLLTGVRPGEAASIRRDHLHGFDGAQAQWVIPETMTKNKKAHLVPLCAMARTTIGELIEIADMEAQERANKTKSQFEPRTFLLESRRMKGKPIDAHALAVAMARFSARMNASDKSERITGPGAETWNHAEEGVPSPHDLRRTVRTRLSVLGIPTEVCDRIMNHTPAGVGNKHYNLHDFKDEKRAALQAWEHTLAAILDPQQAKVIPIARTRARAPKAAG